MKRFLLLFIWAAPLWAINYTAVTSSSWQDSATWVPSGTPGPGDTISINDGITVDVVDARVVGASGPAGSVAINFNNSGAILVTIGGSLTVRGDMKYTANNGVNTSAYLILQAGSSLQFDSSHAASPSTTKYSAYPDSTLGGRAITMAGTSPHHVTVSSNPGGGNGYFRLNGAGGSYTSTYTDFTNIGDSVNPAFALFNAMGIATWSAVHDTFTNCGDIMTNGSLAANDIFQHSFNVHSGSLGTFIINRYGDGSSIAGLTNGIREIVGNLFDKTVGAPGYPINVRDMTISSNYFPSAAYLVDNNWRLFQNNFWRIPRPGDPNSNGGITAEGDMRDNLLFWDDPNTNNPHVIFLGPGGSLQVAGNIWDHTGQNNTDSGEFILTNVNLAPGAYSIHHNILLPTAAGTASTEIASVQACLPSDCTNTGTTFWFHHNTYFGQKNVSPGNQDALHTGEGYANATGQLANFTSNIIWANDPGFAPYKLNGQGHGNLNVCLPANCDYNDGWNTRTDGGSGYTNSGNGYADNFTSLPGLHDLSVNPNFYDPTRNTATFDSAYLGYHPAAWSSNSTYNVGDMVASSDSTVYAGATVNYRYINGTSNSVACGSANPKPGLFTNASRACWEWATLYHLRQAVSAQTLYDDPVIGAHGVDIITTLIQWIRTGFSPTNPVLALAGADGQDIGAVPVTFAPPVYLAPGAGGSVIRGSVVLGGVR